MSKISVVVLSLIIYVSGIRAQSLTSTIKTYKRTFTTYPFSDPNPIANVDKIYPYFRFDGYTDTATLQTWTTVELENQYIKLMILPEIGGKIWAAWDKASGEAFIYNNQVVKFRDVAMRGPWTSGGIEANYGIIGHTPNCATPVDYKTQSNADRSVSCFIGTYDKLTQTSWTIEINLAPDKAYFTTKSLWHNSTPLEQPYYSWMNTGMPSAGNLEFIFPGNRYLGHDGEYADWPINKTNNKNISFYNNNDFGGYKSYHVFGQPADFFATYWHDKDFGMGHYALQDDKPGRKIWIWGLSRQGMIWEQLLTDQDGQYVEIQSGRLFNQSADGSTFTPFKHRGFSPYATDEWTEYWFPVKKTKGLQKVNLYGGFNFYKENNYVKWSFCPVQFIKDTVTITVDQKVIKKKISFVPLKVVRDSILIVSGGDEISFTIGDKFRYSTIHQKEGLARPVDLPSTFDWSSAYGLYLKGKEWQRDRNYIKAEDLLAQSLAADSLYISALAVMAELQYRKMNYSGALQYALKGLSLDTYDPQTNFIYGLIQKALYHYQDARDGFSIAAASTDYKSAAYLELARLDALDQTYDRALSYAMRSTEFNAKNIEALQLLAYIYRIKKNRSKAAEYLTQIYKLNPLNHFVDAERWLSNPSLNNKTQLSGHIQQEFNDEVYLNLADWYLNVQSPKDAVSILGLAPDHTEILYWKAYALHLSGDLSYTDVLHKAVSSSPEMVFPYRTTAQSVFKFSSEHVATWPPKYFLGLLAWSRGNTSAAKDLFESCGEPAFAAFYAAKANLFDDQRSINLEKAMALDGKGWRYGKLLAQEYLAQGHLQEALMIATKYHQDYPANDGVAFLLAKCMIENKKYEAAYTLLMSKTFLPNEGSTEGRYLYREATMQQAIQAMYKNDFTAALQFIGQAAQWPENLGVGKPYDEDIDSRIEKLCTAICWQRMGRLQEAQKLFKDISEDRSHLDSPMLLINALALKMSDQEEQGNTLLESWQGRIPDSPIPAWCLSMYQQQMNLTDPTMTLDSKNLIKSVVGYLNQQ